MRAFTKGEPFMDVAAEGFIPNDEDIEEMKEDNENIPDMPVFSEAFLYTRVGKDDARFILGVAEEYSKVIQVLGEDRVRDLLAQ